MINYLLVILPFLACLITGLINKRKIFNFTSIVVSLAQLAVLFFIKTNDLKLIFLLLNNLSCFVLILFLHTVYTKLIYMRLLTSKKLGIRYAFVFLVSAVTNLSIIIDLVWLLWLSIFAIMILIASIYYMNQDFYNKIKFHVYVLISTILSTTIIYSIIYSMKLAPGSINLLTLDYILTGIGVLLIIAGMFLIYKEKSIMKLYLLTSLVNYGVIITGIGLYTYSSLTAALTHMFCFNFVIMLLFIAGENLCLNYKTDLIEEVGGVISDKPLLGASIFIGLLSITSLPPFALFFSEARLIHNTFSVNNYFISFVLIIKNLLFSYIIFKKTSSVLYGNKKNPDEKRDMILGYSLIVILIFIIIICGLFLPTQLSKLFNNGAAIILGDL